MYHVSPEFFPAGRVLVTRTIPTVYSVPETLGIGPQRVSVNIGLKGLTLNFYSRVIAINIVSLRFLLTVTAAADTSSLAPMALSTGLTVCSSHHQKLLI